MQFLSSSTSSSSNERRGCGAVDGGMTSGGWGPVIGIYGYLSLARPIYQGTLRGGLQKKGPAVRCTAALSGKTRKTKEGRIWPRSECDIGCGQKGTAVLVAERSVRNKRQIVRTRGRTFVILLTWRRSPCLHLWWLLPGQAVDLSFFPSVFLWDFFVRRIMLLSPMQNSTGHCCVFVC